MAAGPSACAVGAVTAVVDTEATEEGVDPRVVFTRGWGGLRAVSATDWAVDACMVGSCVNVLSAWGLMASVGLVVEWPGVCLAGLCVPVGLLTFAVVAAAF